MNLIDSAKNAIMSALGVVPAAAYAKLHEAYHVSEERRAKAEQHVDSLLAFHPLAKILGIEMLKSERNVNDPNNPTLVAVELGEGADINFATLLMDHDVEVTIPAKIMPKYVSESNVPGQEKRKEPEFPLNHGPFTDDKPLDHPDDKQVAIDISSQNGWDEWDSTNH